MLSNGMSHAFCSVMAFSSSFRHLDLVRTRAKQAAARLSVIFEAGGSALCLRWAFSLITVFVGLACVASLADHRADQLADQWGQPGDLEGMISRRLWPSVAMSTTQLSSQTSFDPVFVAKVKAIENAKTAGEFLRVTANLENYSFKEYSRRLYYLLKDRLGSFLKLSPTIQQVNTLRLRVLAKDLDLNVIRAMAPRVSSASELIQLINLYRFDPIRDGKNDYFVQLRVFLAGKIEFFLKLEPTVDELNSFRLQLWEPNSDIKLMEFMSPRLTWARDFTKMVSLFDCRPDSGEEGRDYSDRLSLFLKEHIEMFMQLRPTTTELNKYRQCLNDTAWDFWMLAVGLGNAKSAQEMVDVAIAKQERPSVPPTEYDRKVMDSMYKHIDPFLWWEPSLAQLAAYRGRMGHPNGDLKILDVSLRRAKSVAEALALISQRPQLFTEEFNRAWSQVLARHLDLFISWRPTESEIHSYIDRVFDRELAEQMRTQIRNAGLVF